MEKLHAWHQLATDVALANGLDDQSELKMATELSEAIQTKGVQCWKENGDPIRGAVSFEMLRHLAPQVEVFLVHKQV